MTIPLLTRYADTLRYDRERGVSLALDWRAYPQLTSFVVCDDAEAVARALAAATVGRWAAPYLAGYGLALAARAWADRPSDARRGAIIQAAERLCSVQPADTRLAQFVERALARADAAILDGGAAEAAVVSFVSEQVVRADRVAERCGRIAAGLLDENDRVLTHGFAGPALNWMLHIALTEQAKPVELFVTASHPDGGNARLAVELAREVGVAAVLLDDRTPEPSLTRDRYSVFVAGAEQIGLDGAVVGEPDTSRYAEFALQSGIPRYILGYDGPNPAIATAADFSVGSDIISPGLISAIITNRGIYRPEMIARYLGDGDGPLDVIPLSLG
jgi:methylthioribose-1-phosphate isomerase